MSTSARHVPTEPTGGIQPETWTVLRLMRWSGEYLEAKGVERGRLDAEHLLADALDVERLQLYLQYDRPLLPEELDRYRPLLRRRAGREPLQYILASAGFRELDLYVDGRVLVPRPETEVLVDDSVHNEVRTDQTSEQAPSPDAFEFRLGQPEATSRLRPAIHFPNLMHEATDRNRRVL